MQSKFLAIATTCVAGSQALAIADRATNVNPLSINLDSILTPLRAGQTDPAQVLGGLLSVTVPGTVDQSVVLNQLGQLTQSLSTTNLLAGKPTTLLGTGSQANSQAVIDKLRGLNSNIVTLIQNIASLPIDVNGFSLPTNQGGLCSAVRTLIQVETALVNSLANQSTGVLVKIPLLSSLSSAVLDVQLLVQTLILQVLSLTPLCNVQSSEGMTGLSGIVQNLLDRLKSLTTLQSLSSLLGNNFITGITELLRNLTGNSAFIIPSIPSTPLSGSAGNSGAGAS